ncbi:MAG: MazG nucleotide pyrophosphohydrolase domain-containing protein [Candidatus Thermoplasmatota archaeon]
MKEFQAHIAELYLEKDKRRGVERTFLWFMEEVGELAEAVRRRDDRANLEDEFADVQAWLASLANLLDVELAAVTARKYPEKCKRCGAKPCACEETAVPL